MPFLYESTHLSLEAAAHTQNIAFSANLGPFGLFVKNGELLIDADGNAATSDRAVLDINLTDNNSGTSDGKIPLASIGLSNADRQPARRIARDAAGLLPVSDRLQGQSRTDRRGSGPYRYDDDAYAARPHGQHTGRKTCRCRTA